MIQIKNATEQELLYVPSNHVRPHAHTTFLHLTISKGSERRSPFVPVCPIDQRIRIRKKRQFSRSWGP